VSAKMMMSENQSSQSQVHVRVFRGVGDPVPRPAGGGARFSPNTSHVIRKRSVNATLMIHQARKFHILHTNSQYAIFYNIILGMRKTTNSQDRFPAIQLPPVIFPR
jgi:hypothetical protein